MREWTWVITRPRRCLCSASTTFPVEVKFVATAARQHTSTRACRLTHLERPSRDVESTTSVDAHHREGGRRRSLLAVARDVKARASDRVRAVEQERAKLRGVAVVVHHDRRRGGEERVERGFAERVRVVADLSTRQSWTRQRKEAYRRKN